MTKDGRADAILTIASHYGLAHQSLKAMEELAELIQALAKGKREMILEEMADVHIMLFQLMYLMGTDMKELQSIEDRKLDRQLKRMEKENGRIN